MYTNFLGAQSSIPLWHTVNLSDGQSFPDPQPVLFSVDAVHRPDFYQPEAKQKLHDKRKQGKTAFFQPHGATATPQLLRNFNGNASAGTPNDNNVAISDSGMVISVVNSNIRIYQSSDGKELFAKGLGFFAKNLSNLTRTYDPKVMWDPENKKFILVFLNGALSSFNDLVICFSKTEDPMKEWNCYKIPGNFENDTTWSDYPVMGMSREDVFVTLNKLKDNKGWKDGFVQSIIWQIRKSDGYAGDSLQFVYHNQNYLNGKAVWSICPVQGGMAPTHPNMYFLSVRPGDFQNDTVILHTLSGTVSSGNTSISRKVLKTNKSYGLPPSAPQPDGQLLETNDARVLSAIYENDLIQYVQTTVDTQKYYSGVYHGVIVNPDASVPVLKGNIISSDTADIAYPSLAYSGGGVTDHGAIITFSIVSSKSFAGTACVYVDRDLNGYSPIVMLKEGIGNINLLSDTNERWGDYTGIQRKYNETGKVWINGSFGSTGGRQGTWIAEVVSGDLRLRVENVTYPEQTQIYPNPLNEERLHIRISPQMNKGPIMLKLSDLQGKTIWTYWDKISPGVSDFSFNSLGLVPGVYVLEVKGANWGETHKLIVGK